MSYDIFEHRHRFSAWAAARAAQVRSSIKVQDMREALENCEIVAFLKDSESMQVGQAQFDELHRAWCRRIITFLADNMGKAISFGRAAKLIAVYLKSMVVINTPECRLAQVAHPPIDGIVLKNLSQSAEIQSVHKHEWAEIKWTQLDEGDYYQLVAGLFACMAPDLPRWHLEKYWTVTRE